jgi:hypothetical protein
MQTPTWLKPALMGAGAGAVATMVLGFSQGGWLLGSSAERLADQRSEAAVTAALVPICISQSKLDPDATAKFAQLGAIKSSYERRDFVMKAGWATVPAAEKPDGDLAGACAEVLSKASQS